jgi:antitoxin HicB
MMNKHMIDTKDINYFLSLPYTFQLVREDETTCFARVVELPGCITEGDSPAEALEMIHDAMAGWIEIALADGRPIPEPAATGDFG